MPHYRKQKNLTIAGDKLGTLIDNYGKIPVTDIAKLIGETYNKTRINIELLELNPKKKLDNLISDDNGYFSVEKFSRLYKY